MKQFIFIKCSLKFVTWVSNYGGFTKVTMFFAFRAGKIPKNMLSAYQSACEKVTTEQIEGTVPTNM